MRVLVADQDSASNEAIVRSLRDLYTVDAVTNKADCLDLLRSNTFEVVVAGERLSDGSGLELLGQIARKWSSILRIFAADSQRLRLLGGRLGPFELFQTLPYPIDPERLIATLSLAGAARDANADTSTIQHVVLSGESLSQPSEDTPAPAGPAVSRDFPAPRPISRISPVEHAEAPSRRLRGAGRGGPVEGARAAGAGQRLRGTGTTGPPSQGANSAGSARFPTVPKVPSSEPFRAPRAFNSRRAAVRIGAAAAVVAMVVLGFRLFDPRTEAPPPAPPTVTRAPQPSQEETHFVPRNAAALNSAKSGNSGSAAGHATPKRSEQSRRNAVKAAPDPAPAPIATPTEPAAPPEHAAPNPDAAPVPVAALSVATATPPSTPSTPSAGAPPAPPPIPVQASTVPTVVQASAVQISTAPPRSRVPLGEPPPVIREAKLIRRVTPHYPLAAMRDGLVGSVDLEVTVSPRGVVKDAAVVRGTPPHVFDKSALAAVRRWRYDPRFVDGLPAEAHLAVHLDFSPQ